MSLDVPSSFLTNFWQFTALFTSPAPHSSRSQSNAAYLTVVKVDHFLPAQKWIKMLSKAPRMNFHVTTLRDVSETCFQSVQDVSKHLDIVHLDLILE